MKVTINNNTVSVNRTDDKERFYNESQLLYQIKNELIKQGYDVIKKRMWKDGHLMGNDDTQYIRERNYKFAIYDGEYQIRFLHKDFNKDGYVTLSIEKWSK